MKTFVFIRNKAYRPSTFYRFTQYLEENNNCYLNEFEGDKYYRKKSKTMIQSLYYKVIYGMVRGYISRLYFIIKILLCKEEYQIYIQRECFPRWIGPVSKILYSIVLDRAQNIYWDFDDNIIKGKEISKWEVKKLYSSTTQVIVGNQYLKDCLPTDVQRKTIIIPTTDKYFNDINIHTYLNMRLKNYKNELNIVWLGTKGNLAHLVKIIPALQEAASELDKIIKLNIISDGFVEYSSDKNLIIHNIEWSRDGALKELEKMHIGVMPLSDNEVTRGKCSFKAIQYMGAGLPIVISPVGMNTTLIEEDDIGLFANNLREWKNAIIELGNDIDLYCTRALCSRQKWENQFSSLIMQQKMREYGILRD